MSRYVNKIKVATHFPYQKVKMPMHRVTFNLIRMCLFMDLLSVMQAAITWTTRIIQLARFQLMDNIWRAFETLALPPSQKQNSFILKFSSVCLKFNWFYIENHQTDFILKIINDHTKYTTNVAKNVYTMILVQCLKYIYIYMYVFFL